jgi:hypothetical protein
MYYPSPSPQPQDNIVHGFGHSLHRNLDAAGGAVWNPFPNPSSCILLNGSSLMLPLAFGAFAREQAFVCL